MVVIAPDGFDRNTDPNFTSGFPVVFDASTGLRYQLAIGPPISPPNMTVREARWYSLTTWALAKSHWDTWGTAKTIQDNWAAQKALVTPNI